MRTTIDLAEDLHAAAQQLARDRRQSLSRTVNDLLRQAMQDRPAGRLETDPLTGFPLFRTGRTITAEEVEAFLDED